MIVGVGVDVIEVERLQRTLSRYGQQFLAHVYAEEEQQDAPEGEGKAAYYAGRWAAKEAVAKALGSGIGRECAWTDIRVLRSANGRPEIRLHGAGARTAAALGIDHVHVSISHVKRLACASAVAEKFA